MSSYKKRTIKIASQSKIALLRSEKRLNLSIEFPQIFATIVKSSSGSLSSLRFNDSRTKVTWTCELGHTWEWTPSQRMQAKICPICSGHIFSPGQNDLQTVAPELALEFDVHKNKAKPSEVQAKPINVYWWTCLKGHSYSVAYGYRVEGVGCSVCSSTTLCQGVNDLESQRPEIAAMFDSKKNDCTASQVFDQSNKEFWWLCSLGHSFKRTPNAVTTGSCSFCRNSKVLTGFNDLMTVNPSLAAEFDVVKNKTTPSEVLGAWGKYWWRCAAGHSWQAEVYTRNKKAGCRKCQSGVIKGKNDLITFFPELAAMYDAEQVDPVEAIHREERDIFREWKCLKGHRFTGVVRNLVKREYPCTECDPLKGFRSTLERDIYKEIVKLVDPKDIVCNTKKIISPYELDFYLPTCNLAIEANGDYWHSDRLIRAGHGMSANEYHSMKVQRCREVGVDLIFIWEGEWRKEPEALIEEINRRAAFSQWEWFTHNDGSKLKLPPIDAWANAPQRSN